MFDIDSDEPCSLYYKNNDDGRNRWKRLSSNTDNYYKKVSFKDGYNDITIRTKDRNNNDIDIGEIKLMLNNSTILYWVSGIND